MTNILKMPAVAEPTEATTPTGMPIEIVGAVLAVSGQVGSVAKSAFNEHGRYKFASTDDVYAATNRIMAENGLLVTPLIAVHEVVRLPAPMKEKGQVLRNKDGSVVMTEVAWLREVYRFMLSCGSVSWTHDDLIEPIFVQINGPQTFQAARSFAIKSFMRSLFKIPTGDYDLDQTPQDDGEARPAKRRKSSSQAKQDGDWTAWEARLSELERTPDRWQASEWYDAYRAEIETAPAAWAKLINDRFDDHCESLMT